MLLHSQDDEPLVGEMGFVIGPGMHSLAGLNYQLVCTFISYHSISYADRNIHDNKIMLFILV
jgi:hypothetical protein